MCGICGILNVDRPEAVDRSLLQGMCDAIRHRGPDEEGFHFDGEIGLGIRRLKIIDLSTGRQPIHNEDRTVWLVFNGEIYNYKELRASLEKKGHRFHTSTDTEPIVHLYEDHGERCVERLRGMFAFALWDTRRKRLMLARDRVGIKQLYYSHGAGSLRFGSEIKCLLRHPAQKRTVDLKALRSFFAYHYIPGERTIFEDVRRLPPGHFLLCEKGKCSLTRYWDLEPRPRQRVDERELIEEFRHLFRETVRIHLMSDVPLGAFLSGGIDSSAVVGEMAALSSAPVKTFTIGYDAGGAYYDERSRARLIAQRFGTDHHEFVVKPDVEDILPQIIRSFDEPFADSSAIPSYYVAKLTREHVTVALSGLGGDEVGAGYERYLGGLAAEHYEKVPRLIRSGLIAGLVRRLPDSRRGGLAVDRLKRFIAGVEHGFPERYRRYLSTFTPEELDQLLVPEVREGSGLDAADDRFAEVFGKLRSHDTLTQMIFTDIATYLPDDLLVLTDRLSMAHSLEARVPFVDHELLEFAATVPSRLKLRGWTKKYFLRKAFEGSLPREVLWGRKKGFSIPLAVWLRGPLRGFLLDALSEDRLQRLGYFDERTVSTLIDEHLECRHNHENKLWALLMFTLWHQIYMEG